MGNKRRIIKQGMSSFPLPRSVSLTFCIALQKFIALVDDAPEIQDGQVFPFEYREPLERLWRDRGVQHACQRGNEYALPENLP
jgi:hypothetical protein